MLGVHAAWHAGEGRHGHEFQCCEVAAVYYVGSQAPQYAPGFGVEGKGLARGLVQRDEFNPWRLDAQCEYRVNIGHRQYGMPELVGGQLVDELHHHIFQAAGGEAVDKVDDVADGRGGHRAMG